MGKTPREARPLRRSARGVGFRPPRSLPSPTDQILDAPRHESQPTVKPPPAPSELMIDNVLCLPRPRDPGSRSPDRPTLVLMSICMHLFVGFFPGSGRGRPNSRVIGGHLTFLSAFGFPSRAATTRGPSRARCSAFARTLGLAVCWTEDL